MSAALLYHVLGPDSAAAQPSADSRASGPPDGRAAQAHITLDDTYADKLSALADASHLERGTLARSILCSALDTVDASAATITDVLDAIPGALDRARRGMREIEAGAGIPLDEL